ncbi:hypothetical protein HGO53_01140 [Wolbachia endosymbiont of Diaphorina citri]|jgi:hypothetical protein|uniref:hypothetical protein n=1 Tax=Wolbachia endosymbiont of Diaphorina citri TaxID=116598 RepID=UPI00155F005C|nr:hypothetical protein [Wolbachia endosymbiont of Diaphorina citri]QJT95028.1 hypothetical protein HGO48_07030 [Wolbachia endosymbiont of Diaphorina citri]QJT96270.1 hypothetical protein HGO49_07095 [Wolbachia endosymbiont of Diaphorina citri]QJT96575.1 hypothetical protein HGO53_01140 [Wolbachia endosymbiont of Diaphorina citri]QLK11721.1 hypothetical protein FK497_05835 [Wolbachia endosymbiont of Diaphorina citri]QXY86653.1 hypothetical protein GZ064_01180 [Wolbachia endosymbiont of Diaphor
MNFKDLHNAICTTLKREISSIQTCEVYPAIRKELVAPAVFVELSGFEKGHDPGTEELALKVRFEARIVVDGTVEYSSLVVRSLAAEVARVVNKNTWNVKNISPAEFLSAEPDGFRPELDAYLVWMVDWSHQLHLGKSVWEEGEIKPHTINVGNINVRP